jgi:prepilin-type N-terminal cleavage/methylation domain-containing protein
MPITPPLRERLHAIRRNDKGFTLIEPVIVVVLLGALSGIAYSTVGGSAERVATVACQADKKTVRDAADAYYAINGSYATSMDVLVTTQFLRAAPATTNGYTITYDHTGAVGVAPGGACD